MTLQIHRSYRLLVFPQTPSTPFFDRPNTGVEIDLLDIQYSVEKNLATHPNTAEVTLFNLNDRSRSEFDKRPLMVELAAGYSGVNKLLFLGDVRPGSYSRIDGGEWKTKLILADGGRAFSQARISKSYSPGTPLLTVVRDSAQSLGLLLPKALDSSAVFRQTIPTGEVCHGFASDELTRLLAQYGFSWSIQNGQLQVLGGNQVNPGQAVVISQQSGMLGSPEITGAKEQATSGSASTKPQKPPRLNVDHQLFPELIPGQHVQVVSRSFAKGGFYKLDKVTHSGDTKSDDWNTKLEAVAT